MNNHKQNILFCHDNLPTVLFDGNNPFDMENEMDEPTLFFKFSLSKFTIQIHQIRKMKNRLQRPLCHVIKSDYVEPSLISEFYYILLKENQFQQIVISILEVYPEH